MVWMSISGGEGGIRTHGTLARTTVFETVLIDHSSTSPGGVISGRHFGSNRLDSLNCCVGGTLASCVRKRPLIPWNQSLRDKQAEHGDDEEVTGADSPWSLESGVPGRNMLE